MLETCFKEVKVTKEEVCEERTNLRLDRSMSTERLEKNLVEGGRQKGGQSDLGGGL